jgi:hypothetical protein
MYVEIGTEAPIFLFWEYLFRNFGILSLQCGGYKWGWGVGVDWIDIPLFVFNTFSPKVSRNTGGPVLVVDLGENSEGRHFQF